MSTTPFTTPFTTPSTQREPRNLVLRAGSEALAEIREEGLSRDRITTLVGASGGPKWLVLSQLDRVLNLLGDLNTRHPETIQKFREIVCVSELALVCAIDRLDRLFRGLLGMEAEILIERALRKRYFGQREIAPCAAYPVVRRTRHLPLRRHNTAPCPL